MKKSLFYIFLILAISYQLSAVSSIVRAQSPTKKVATPTPKVTQDESDSEKDASTPTPESESLIDKLKQIKILKDKIATKVAEIRENEKGGLAGIVKSVDTNSIVLAGQDGNRTIHYSDDTTFYTVSGTTKTESTVKKVREGDMLSAVGYFGDNTNTLSAKFIYIPTALRHIVGKVADIDKENYTITIKEKQGNQVVDIETSTRIFQYTDTKTRQRGGFSKIKVGDMVHIIAIPNAKDVSKVSGSKIFVLPPFSGASAEVEPTSAATPTKAAKAASAPTTAPTKAPTKATPTP